MTYKKKQYLLRKIRARDDARLTSDERRERNYWDNYGIVGADVGYPAHLIKSICVVTDTITV